MIAFGIPADTGPAARWWGRPLPTAVLPFGRANCELDLLTGAGEAITVLAMREDAFFEIVHRLTGLDPGIFLQGGHFLAIRPQAIAPLRAFWNGILACSGARTSCIVGVAQIVDSLVNALKLPARASRSGAPKAGVVDIVLHEAKKSGYQASVPEISMSLNISRRTIEYAFQQHLGVSPRAYFTLRRLNLCRQALIEANPECTTVTNHGFYELGRFSWVYRHHLASYPRNR